MKLNELFSSKPDATSLMRVRSPANDKKLEKLIKAFAKTQKDKLGKYMHWEPQYGDIRIVGTDSTITVSPSKVG